MPFFETYAKEIVSLSIPILTLIIDRFFRLKVKLLRATPHVYTFIVPEPIFNDQGKIIKESQSVNTVSYLIKNAGSLTATGVEIVFNWKPPCVNIWPIRPFDERNAQDGRYVMIFNNLSPGEIIGLELIAVNRDNPDIVNVRSEQCRAKTIEMYPQPVAPKWKVNLFVFFALLGFGAAIYIVLNVLQFIILKSPS